MTLLARYATHRDLDFVAQDGYLPTSTVAAKISDGEVIVVEREGELLGYARARVPGPNCASHMGVRECGRLQDLNIGGVAEVFFRKVLVSAFASHTSGPRG